MSSLNSVTSPAVSYLSKSVPSQKVDEQPILLASAAPEKKPGAAAQNSLITWAPFLVQDMNSDDTANWQRSAWSNGDPFNVGWRPDHISFNNGIMTLKLDNAGCPSGCSSKPFASGEYRTKKEVYRYGYYEGRMRAGAGEGTVSSFFNYTGTWGQPNHYEIDFEVLGKNCGAVQTNYYIKGVGQGQHEEMIALPFNVCTEFHNYGFKWDQNSIVWYVDGKKVRSESVPTNLPESSSEGKTKIMVNFWNGIGVDGWLGPFSYHGPIQAQYDWIKYSPLDTNAAPAPKPAPSQGASAPAPTAPANAILVASSDKGHPTWNGGSASVSNGEYTFKADGARDPGMTILLNNVDVKGKKALKFEIKGKTEQLGGYARFIAQIYKPGDSDSSPSLSLDPVDVSSDFKTVTFDLEGISKIWKIQYMLVTDAGNVNVVIRNQRFE